MKAKINLLNIFQKLKSPKKKTEKSFNRYEEAKREYIDTHMDMAVALHSWKLIAFGSMAVTFVSVIIVF